MYLEPSKPATTDEYNRGEVKGYQNVLKLDYPTYQQLVRRWCTPDRPPLLNRSDAPPADEADDDADAAAAAARPKGKKARA